MQRAPDTEKRLKEETSIVFPPFRKMVQLFENVLRQKTL
jgi:hypothetical protein